MLNPHLGMTLKLYLPGESLQDYEELLCFSAVQCWFEENRISLIVAKCPRKPQLALNIKLMVIYLQWYILELNIFVDGSLSYEYQIDKIIVDAT